MDAKFDRTGRCVITLGEGDSEVVTKGRFEADFSKRPIPLTIRGIPELTHPLHTIIEFRGSDELRMAGFSPRWRLRPIAFDPSTSVNLKRTVGIEP